MANKLIARRTAWRYSIRPGDCFTIEGHMRGRNGQLVIDGVNPKTGRKCKSVSRVIYIAAGEV